MESESKPAFSLRLARESDAEALLAVYAPYVRDTTVTFEWEVPTAEEFAARIRETMEGYPYYVAEMNGVPVGYAYAHRLRVRRSYDWTAEMSIYVAQSRRGLGIGRALYTALENALRRQNVALAVAYITAENPASVAFHRAMGYSYDGEIPACAYKLGRWIGLVSMHRRILPENEPPREFIPFSALR